jgi:hypothetical protein
VSPAVLPVPCRGTQSTLKVNDLWNTQRYFFSDGVFYFKRNSCELTRVGGQGTPGGVLGI